MRQQVLGCQLLRDGQKGIAVCLLLVQAPQLLRQSLQATQKLGDGNGLSGAPCQGLIEGQAGGCCLLLVCIVVNLGYGASATARTGHDGSVSRRRWDAPKREREVSRRRRRTGGWTQLAGGGLKGWGRDGEVERGAVVACGVTWYAFGTGSDFRRRDSLELQSFESAARFPPDDCQARLQFGNLISDGNNSRLLSHRKLLPVFRQTWSSPCVRNFTAPHALLLVARSHHGPQEPRFPPGQSVCA